MLEQLYYAHCAPLERGCWAYPDSIDISLLWSERQGSSTLTEIDFQRLATYEIITDLI